MAIQEDPDAGAVRPPRLTWKAALWALAVVTAWFVYVWLSHRLIHSRHAEAEAAWGLAGALAVEIAATSAGAIVLAAILRGHPGTWRQALSIAFWMALIVVGHYIAFIENMSARALLEQVGMDDSLRTLALVSGFYALLVAVPFVPGIEIGLLIIALYGPWGALAVYLATSLALNAGFAVGCGARALSISPERLAQWMTAGGERHGRAEKSSMVARLSALWPRLSRYRYLLLGILLNLPGNAVLGGGGGIAFLSGASGRLAWRWYAVTVLVATSPVPLLAAAGLLSLEMLK
jgi:hypothetical protein